jgi:hypothetical protein
MFFVLGKMKATQPYNYELFFHIIPGWYTPAEATRRHYSSGMMLCGTNPHSSTAKTLYTPIVFSRQDSGVEIGRSDIGADACEIDTYLFGLFGVVFHVFVLLPLWLFGAVLYCTGSSRPATQYAIRCSRFFLLLHLVAKP